MHAFTETRLTGQRITLRWLTPDDAGALFAIRSDPEVARYGAHPPMASRDLAVNVIERDIAGYADRSALRFAIERNEDGLFLGTVSLYAMHTTCRRCDIGYELGRAHWGKGYAGEAVALALRHAFDSLDLIRIEADIHPDNTASAKLLERMGFVREGYMRQRWIVAGEVSDSAVYGLLRSEFSQRATDPS